MGSFSCQISCIRSNYRHQIRLVARSLIFWHLWIIDFLTRFLVACFVEVVLVTLHFSLSCRLNSAIIGTPITLFTTNYRYTHTPTASSRGRGKSIMSTTQLLSILSRYWVQQSAAIPRDKHCMIFCRNKSWIKVSLLRDSTCRFWCFLSSSRSLMFDLIFFQISLRLSKTSPASSRARSSWPRRSWRRESWTRKMW